MHELLHAAGMKHEQSRCDRDDWVKIFTSKIIQDADGENIHQFDKHCDGYTDVYEYDFGSIMHYSPYAFSVDGLPTMVPKTNWPHLFFSRMAKMGNRSSLSDADIATANHMYPIDKDRMYALLTLYPVPGTNERLGVEVSSAKLQLNRWKGYGGQRFQFIPATDGYYYIKSAQTGAFITVPGASTSDNAAISLESLTNGTNQQFRLEPVSWGTYRLVARHSGKDLITQHVFPGFPLMQGPSNYTGQYQIVTVN